MEQDEEQPDFVKHTREELLHDMEAIRCMTESRAYRMPIMKDIPQRVWRDYDKANKPRLVICKYNQLPKTREWRNSWGKYQRV